VGKFAASIERPIASNVSALGELCLLTPDQRLCPWTLLGAAPPDRHHGASQLYWGPPSL